VCTGDDRPRRRKRLSNQSHMSRTPCVACLGARLCRIFDTVTPW
jgi:hypothetical protein